MNMTQWKNRQPCQCTSQGYIVPHVVDIPHALNNLTRTDILALRPIDFDCGIYERHPTGYRLKKGMIKLVVSDLSVEEKIQSIADDVAHVRCTNAYTFLMNSADSRYSYYISLQNSLVDENKQLNETIGIECPLWPNLYPILEMKDGKQVHHLKHPEAEFALNLRAYISTVLPTLKCSMDYQPQMMLECYCVM